MVTEEYLPETTLEDPTGGSVDILISDQARELSARLQAHRMELFPPEAHKTLRSFQIGEVAKLLGLKSGYLRNLALEGKGPTPTLSSGGRRMYSAEQILELRRYLDQNARGSKRYLPRRVEGEHLQVIAVVNFKGGSGKTTSAAHLSQYLALSGLRVLAIDLDPQASLSALHGFQPEFDVHANETLYGAIRYDDERRPLSKIIRKTNFPGLDIVPGNIELMEFEYETPRLLASSEDAGGIFFSRVDQALQEVQDNYDVVVIDCPPQLGYLTMAAVCAATGILVTVHPQMLDVMSMCQFLLMMGDVMSHLRQAGGNMSYDWMRYLLTRYEPSDGPQIQMAAFMRSLFGEHVLTHPMLKSTAISDSGITKQTLYEIERKQFTGSTYDRALESVNAVNSEILQLIFSAWGR
ncbi:MAG: plasmid partitioning protein RepA [Acetobacter aceti]|uniref:Sporulation initiation inhibitor protein Soj n=1 Tax=Komagataeibacter saccharivorans TaxID=265959 RepID=A0A347WHD1_9PROT|nr:plasmid partitioning protein RepA [Komagataeibacter saccharivorans]AXY24274.1 Sporulation initiation inhibitor protein Soj [Komagataeibacter saccharivorans]